MKTAVLLVSKTFFPQHPKAGQQTYFSQKIKNKLSGLIVLHRFRGDMDKGMPCFKRHTIRQNYEYWKNKIDKLKADGGVLSIRQWAAKPYRSQQEIVAEIPAESIGVQKLRMFFGIDHALITDVGGKMTIIKLERVAENDGLTPEDFNAWFLPVFKKDNAEFLDLAIIHFTKFRY